MKSMPTKLALMLLLALSFSTANAQIIPAIPVFDGNTGVMKLPNLLFDGGVYYLELSVADAASLTMKIEESTLVDVTPSTDTVGNSPALIVGTWSVQEEPETTFTFNADGTWEQSQAAGVDDEECPEGGIESGTFRYTASTGVFMPTFLVNDNGTCGLSSEERLIRLFPDGNTLTVLIGTEESVTLELVE